MDRELSTLPYQELAGQFTTRLDVLLAAKRTLVRAWLDLATSWQGQVHHVFGSETADAALDRLHAEIEALQRRREGWVPRTSPDDPRYWIATYDKLARLAERAAGSSPGLEARHLAELAGRYRRRQQQWQRRAVDWPQGGEPPEPLDETDQPSSARASDAKSSTTRSGA